MAEYMIVTDAVFQNNDEEDYSGKICFVNIKCFPSAVSEEPISDVNADDFYTRLRSGALPVTKPVDCESFKEAFSKVLEKGPDVLFIGISSGLSEGVSEAEKAKALLESTYPDRRIVIADSRTAGKGEELLVKAAVSAAEAGMDIDAVVSFINEKRQKMTELLMADGFYNLKRLGKLVAQDTIDSKALKIKPIIGIDEEGKLCVVSRQRGLGNAYNYLVEKLKECKENETGNSENAFSDKIIYISHAGANERAEKVKMLLEEAGFTNKVVIDTIAPVYGTHTGAGAVSIAVL